MKLNQPPAWRWQRARDLVDKRCCPKRNRDDAIIIDAWRYLTKYRKDSLRIEEHLAVLYPDIHQAKNLYEDTYSGMRWIFEAGVMARKSLDELAEYLNAEKTVLAMYENLFFDVRGSLEHKGCIAANVLMPAFKAGVKPRDPDFAWKLFAYEGGWDVVKSMWEIGEVHPLAIDFVNRTFREQVLRLARDAAFSAMPNNFNAGDLIGRGIDMLRLEHDAGDSGSREHSQLALGTLLGSIGLGVQKARAQLPAEEPRQLAESSLIFARRKPKQVDVTVDGKGSESAK